MSEMLRLQDLMADPAGKISYVVRGFQNKDGGSKLEVTLDGMLQLRCQRCLNALAYPVKLCSCLLLVQEGDLEEPSDEQDDRDSIQADKHMNVLAMLEEEILLSLPFAPKHPIDACQPAIADTGLPVAEKKPFAALARLKVV